PSPGAIDAHRRSEHGTRRQRLDRVAPGADEEAEDEFFPIQRRKRPMSFSRERDISIESAHTPASWVTRAAAGSRIHAPSAEEKRATRFWKGCTRFGSA